MILTADDLKDEISSFEAFGAGECISFLSELTHQVWHPNKIPIWNLLKNGIMTFFLFSLSLYHFDSFIRDDGFPLHQ